MIMIIDIADLFQTVYAVILLVFEIPALSGRIRLAPFLNVSGIFI